VNDAIRQQYISSHGKSSRRRVLAQLQKFRDDRARDVQPALTNSQQQKIQQLKAEVLETQKRVANANAKLIKLSKLAQIAKTVNISTLPSSCVTRSSPMMAAVAEISATMNSLISILQQKPPKRHRPSAPDTDDNFFAALAALDHRDSS